MTKALTLKCNSKTIRNNVKRASKTTYIIVGKGKLKQIKNLTRKNMNRVVKNGQKLCERVLKRQSSQGSP